MRDVLVLSACLVAGALIGLGMAWVTEQGIKRHWAPTGVLLTTGILVTIVLTWLYVSSL